jgi:uncharacterized protein YegL
MGGDRVTRHSLARRYAESLVGAPPSTNTMPVERTSSGHSLWHRYWTSLLGMRPSDQPTVNSDDRRHAPSATAERSSQIDQFKSRSSTDQEERRQFMPFYLVCDESSSMAGTPIQTLNDSLSQLRVEVASNPVISDRVRFCMIGFSSNAEVLLPLSDLSSIDSMPKLKAGGMTNYRAAFNVLRQAIDDDIRMLKTTGGRVHRPVVFFISDGRPTGEWESSVRALTDTDWRPHPNILAFGFGDADKEILRTVATERAYIADRDVNPALALTEFTQSMTISIVRSAAPAMGEPDLRLPGLIPGFKDVTETEFRRPVRTKRDLSRSLGRVLNRDGVVVGTCFQVAPGVFVTASHVLGAAGTGRGDVPTSVELEPISGGKRLQARVSRLDHQHDLAILESDSSFSTAAPPLARDPSFDSISVFGLTERSGHDSSYQSLNLSSQWTGRAQGNLLLDIPITAKDTVQSLSGAPVVSNADGSVVGVVLGVDYSTGKSGTLTAVRSENLIPLLTGIVDEPAGPWI